VSPTSKSLDNPQVIQALSFTLYDNLGNILNVNSNNTKVKWLFPIVDTLLVKTDLPNPKNPNDSYV